MFRVFGMFLLVSVLALTACSAPVTPSTGDTPGAPVSTRTPVPLPPQPTSQAIPTRAATPFASATFSSIINAAPTGAPVTAAPTRAAATQPAATQASAGPSAPGVATGVRSEIKVDFVESLETAEAVDDLRLQLKQVPGIIDIAGNETSITVGYDAGLILPNQIRARLASIGHAVKP
jgi:hypothetical protein